MSKTKQHFIKEKKQLIKIFLPKWEPEFRCKPTSKPLKSRSKALPCLPEDKYRGSPSTGKQIPESGGLANRNRPHWCLEVSLGPRPRTFPSSISNLDSEKLGIRSLDVPNLFSFLCSKWFEPQTRTWPRTTSSSELNRTFQISTKNRETRPAASVFSESTYSDSGFERKFESEDKQSRHCSRLLRTRPNCFPSNRCCCRCCCCSRRCCCCRCCSASGSKRSASCSSNRLSGCFLAIRAALWLPMVNLLK